MSQINERTQKLLILAGDQGPAFQARDFKKINEVIVNSYISSAKPAYFQFFSQTFPSVIRRVPLKQHLYAGLMRQIFTINQQYALSLLKIVVANLEKDINSLKLHESINGVIFLSQLMNLQNLNSQSFFDIIDDIVAYLENCKNSNHRSFFVQFISRTIHNYFFSLNKKVPYELKKLIERAKKYCNKNTQFAVLVEAYSKETLNDLSIVHRIYQQINPCTDNQIQQNIKLKISIPQDQKFIPIEYYFCSIDQSDKLYQQFHKKQGPHHTTNLQQIIQLMKQNSQFMFPKIITYVNSQQQQSSFIHRFVVDFLIAKALKSKCTVVQSTILIRLIRAKKIYAQIVESALHRGIHFQCQNYDLGCLMKFAETLTFIANNWPSGGNQMTEVAPWDWDKFLSTSQTSFNQEQEAQKGGSPKKNVLLSIICLKMTLLNQSFNVPNQLKKFVPPVQFSTPTKYKIVQKMQLQAKFQELIKRKSQSSQVLQSIKSQSDYQIFLESLFERTSQSHKHLQVLFSRYQKIFLNFKQNQDWCLLNTIRSYWSKSLFHRLLYLETVIGRGFVEFDSYVKYIGKVQTSNEEESCWVKLELNQLHNIFAERLDNKV